MSDSKMIVKKRNGLGRGLGALLENPADNHEQAQQQSDGSYSVVSMMNEISLEHIETNPYQPRTHFDQDALEELAESIRTQGIIQPITVRQLSQNKYQLISGERRFQASRMAGLQTIPAYVRTANDQQMLEMALIENIQRENLNAIEIALSYQRLISECSLKQEELGERVGKKRSTVNNYLRLLKLPPEIQAAIRDNYISMGHARAIVNVENIETQLSIFNRIISDELSVRKVEEIVRDLATIGLKKLEKEEVTPKTQASIELQSIQSKLTTHFGTKVQIKSSDNKKGEIKIPFTSADELNRILELFSF